MLNGNYGLILLYLSLFFLISTDMYLRTNVPFQYTILGDREQVFLLYYKDFFEQICSDVQFISPPEEVGEFLLHLLNAVAAKEREMNGQLLQLERENAKLQAKIELLEARLQQQP